MLKELLITENRVSKPCFSVKLNFGMLCSPKHVRRTAQEIRKYRINTEEE